MHSLGIIFFSLIACSQFVPSPLIFGVNGSSNLDHEPGVGDSIFKGASGRSEESLKTLKLVQFVFRHGARNSIHYVDSPLIVHFPPRVGLGQLTEEGKVELMEVGQMLRTRYDGFLSRTYDLDQILMKSAYMDRSIQSADALLAKLFPDPLAFVPVHSVSPQLDNKMTAERIMCPRFQQLLATQVDKLNAKIRKDQKSSMEELSRVFSMPIKNLNDILPIDDNLVVMSSNGLPAPLGVTPALLKTMDSDLSSFRIAQVASPEMEQLYTGPLFEDLLDNMERSLNGSSSRRSHGFSSTDFVLAGFLHTLRMFKDIPPPFAAIIIIELHQQEQKQPEVKFFYRMDGRVPPMELQNSACGQPCFLPNLRKAFSHLLNITSNYEDRCRAQ